MYKYQGAIHIHTKFSDGSGNIEEISKCAKRTGLKWIIITDHNNLSAEEGIINGIYVIKGEEISPADGNHYLALGINETINPSDDVQKTVQSIREMGGFGICAHPDEQDKRKNKYKPLKWQDKSIEPDGVEIWNWFSQWGDNYHDRNLLTILYSYLFRNKFIKKPYCETLKWWDELNFSKEKIIPAIGGLDAHAMKIHKYFIPVTVFPYEFMFKKIVNEIILNERLSEDFEKGKKEILNAIKNGNNLIFNKSVCKNPPEIFISNNEGNFYSGETLNLDFNTFLNIKCAKNCIVKIFRNGIEMYKDKGEIHSYKIAEKGKFRVEIELNRKGYAYSNPIIVK